MVQGSERSRSPRALGRSLSATGTLWGIAAHHQRLAPGKPSLLGCSSICKWWFCSGELPGAVLTHGQLCSLLGSPVELAEHSTALLGSQPSSSTESLRSSRACQVIFKQLSLPSTITRHSQGRSACFKRKRGKKGVIKICFEQSSVSALLRSFSLRNPNTILSFLVLGTFDS